MRKLIYLFIAFMLSAGSVQIMAQQFSDGIKSAKQAYESGNLEDARFKLQQVLQEINKEIGKEVLAILPSNMKDLKFIPEEDEVTGTSGGFAGLFINRLYAAGDSTVNFEIVSDSPMLGAINSILSMPVFMGSGDSNQKRIKLQGYKGLMEKSVSEENIVSWEIQVPFKESLLTLRCQNFDKDQEVLDMANTIPLKQIVQLTQ
jgi:hypothetical protein